MESRQDQLRARAPAPGMPRGRVRRPLVLSRSVWSLGSWPRLLAVGAVLLGIFWLFDRLLIQGPPPRVDVALLEFFVASRTDETVRASRVLTFLGDLWVVVAVWAVLVTLARRQSGRWDLAWLVTVVIFGGLFMTGLIKEITDRARPDGALVEAASFAFPSGHAGRAAAVWGLAAWLALRWGRRALTQWGVGLLAVAMALATGLSRLVLGIHWPSDVLFGWLLGVAWLVACILVVQPRHGIPKPETVLDEITDVLSHSLLGDEDTAPDPPPDHGDHDHH